jgi:nucleotide-binding universal stress UspA family protein
MFHKIILAVDGSESAWRALKMAADLARISNGAITVVNAYQAVSPLLGNPDYNRRVEEHIGHSEQIVEAAEAELRQQGITQIEQDILEGPAATAIINAAKARHADVIVLGSRGLTPMKALLMGSVSERVIGAAPCPVLVLH